MEIKESFKKSIETGSGKSWTYWVELLESAGASNLSHGEIARIVHRHGVNDWWSQGIAVAYEQHIGRRIPGQTCDGDFQVTVTQTISAPMDEALAQWIKRVEGLTEFDGVKISRQPSISQTAKWRYWRCSLEDKSAVSVNIQTKPDNRKSSLAINHNKIQNPADVERWRTFWKDFIR